MSHPPTDETVSAAQSGDAEAFRELYVGLWPAVFGYIRAKGVEDPEAVAQEVFLTIFDRLETVTGGARGLRTFAFSVAHARMVDDQRRRSRRPLMTEFDVDTDERISESAENTALAAMPGELTAHLNALKPDQREVLLLRVVADLPLDQVAAIMGKSIGAVKQLQRRALISLKQRLETEEVENEPAWRN